MIRSNIFWGQKGLNHIFLSNWCVALDGMVFCRKEPAIENVVDFDLPK
jgi:hypothetical protein